MGRRRLIASAAALLAGLAGAALLSWGRGLDERALDAGTREVERQAERLSGQLSSAASTARMRADALAAMPVVRAAVETDAATVQDLARDNFVFAPKKNEVIEFFRVTGDRVISLLRLPESARRLKVVDPKAVEIDEDGESLWVTVAAGVAALYEQGKAGGGAIALSSRIDLDGVRQAFDERGVAGSLHGLADELVLSGGKQDLTGAPSVPVPTGAEASVHGLTLRARVSARPGTSLRLAGDVALGVGLLFALLAMVARRRSRPSKTRTSVNPPAAAPLSHAFSSDDLQPLPQLVPATGDRSVPIALVPERTDLLAGRYRILQHIGTGSHSDVYMAQSFQPAGGSAVVALKVLRTDAHSSTVIERFIGEAQTSAQVQHKNVVSIFDYGESAGTYFSAMEYVEGIDLATLLGELRANGEVMPLKQSAMLALAVCQGLLAAHEVNLVHGDLRPSSVMIGRHGSVKVLGFGGRDPGRLCDYVAPEQFLGKKVDPRVDVYAVGVILRELCTGTHVELKLEGALQLGRRAWPSLLPPSKLRPELPRGLDALVGKALQWNPKHRYPCCRGMGEALEYLLETSSTAPSSGVLADWVERVRRSSGGGT